MVDVSIVFMGFINQLITGGAPPCRYPLVICDIAIENGPVEIVDLPSKNGDFS